MAHRVLIAIVVMVVGLFVLSSPASAAPSYGALGVSATVDDSTVDVGGTVVFSGDGFEPFEDITVVVSTLGPDGLTVVETYRTQADGNGHFELKVPLTHLGTATLTATGLTSGKTVSLTVQVGPDQSNGGTAPTTTIAAGLGSSSGGGAGSSSAGGTGLAYTGASILGPLAVGAAALFAGLAMLFFGTRGAIRRKRPTPTPSG